MRSFVALASLAFATVASALPAMGVAQDSGLARRDVVDAKTTVENVANNLAVLSPSTINAANANAKQSRGAPVDPYTGYHTGLLDAASGVTGLAKADLIAKVLALVDVDISGIKATAIVGLLPIDLKILAVVQALVAHVDIDVIIGKVGDNVETFPTHGYTKRDGAGSAGALVGGLATTLTGAGSKAARGAEVRALGDILVDIKAQIHTLCHDLTVSLDAAVSASAALDVSLSILAKIKAVLVDATVEIQALVDAHIDGALCLNGVAITVQVVAQIIADIVAAVVIVVGLVLKACATVKTDVLLQLIVDVTVALTACINVAALIAVNVVVEIKPLIEAVVHIIIDLHLDALIKIFALVA
ncbi:hypothetical protein P691DRAFT_773967 [Macrolepiota fuliginosa MF-IS2]|uniref:Cell wall galactomannoprotein n=1 Tax=Macrolepiota fuliginosa MF-IS2 TaxID=1400762 RepID=A0A9P6C380_9AGAR|nr:hypothetical protein P691DRAFT_773967 [Macrolepiota fuliginosa MF-IS2]